MSLEDFVELIYAGAVLKVECSFLGLGLVIVWV